MSEFEEFVRSEGPALSRLAYLLTGDRMHAEDLVQIALWKTYRGWTRISSMESPTGYVRQVVVREFLSWRRRRWTREVLVDGEGDVTGVLLSPDHSHELAEADAVKQFLDMLPRKQRAVLVLRYYLDLPDDEIATLLGCSSGTVRSNAMRGLNTLRSKLPAYREEGVGESD